MEYLYDKLVSYGRQKDYPMHMPGHKRNTKLITMENPYAIDITEIPGFDNLHQPEGILKELSDRMSKLYHSHKAFPLVNGSTAGILAGISAATNRGDKVLVARNCHRSVYHGISLRELKPVYLYPEEVEEVAIHCGISPEIIEDMLINEENIKLVVITSPTYEGVVSDIQGIANVVHKYGAVLMVDEAHGAHLGFHACFPKSAVTLGADIVVQSLHKTLPAFTQSAVLHINLPSLEDRLRKYLSIYQSSSPSYLLLAGMDQCIKLLEDQAESLFENYFKNLQHFYKQMEQLKSLGLIGRELIGRKGVYDLDPSKLTITVNKTGLTGHQLGEMLRERFHIVVEMESRDYLLGITSISDTKEGFERLEKALLTIDSELYSHNKGKDLACIRKEKQGFPSPIQALLPYEVMDKRTEIVKLKDSYGRISADNIALYPPGAPILVAGEIIRKEFIEYIEKVVEEGFTVNGLHGNTKDQIEVIQ
jgi:arginine decarboxylase